MDQETIEREKLNQETSQIAWQALQRFFATGQAISVVPELDLINAAYAVSQDDAAQVEKWMADGKLCPVSDSQAIEWLESDAMLWTVVVKPWVLVQNREENK
jgi:hypothetical protein